MKIDRHNLLWINCRIPNSVRVERNLFRARDHLIVLNTSSSEDAENTVDPEERQPDLSTTSLLPSHLRDFHVSNIPYTLV